MEDKQTVENEIVLIAEGMYRDPEKISKWDTTLEMADKSYVGDLENALKQIAQNVFVYSNPKEFQLNISKHINALVMTIYGGKDSRNRMALVPAVCESYGIDFMGADTYARILCQDKFLTKQYAERLGMKTPNYVLVEREGDLSLLDSLKFPLVIKPNLEGTSIGISSKNLSYSIKDAKKLTIEILSRLKQPVLVEEFCKGREVSLCLAGSPKEVKHFEAVEDIHRTQSDFFDSHLYCSDLKVNHYNEFTHELITNEISTEVREVSEKVFMRLGKCDYLRIDGKLANEDFSLIELTPDPYLARGSGFSKSFILAGIPYESSIKKLISICRKNLQSPCASGRESRDSKIDY